MNAGPISTFTYKKLHDFTAGSDGATPLSGLTMDQVGNLYGTAYAGGAGYGTAYQLLNTGTSWSFSPIYTFAGGNDGQGPASRVVFGPNGGLYGTTTHGGDGTGDCTFGYTGCGTVFNLKRQPCRTARPVPGVKPCSTNSRGITMAICPIRLTSLSIRQEISMAPPCMAA